VWLAFRPFAMCLKMMRFCSSVEESNLFVLAFCCRLSVKRCGCLYGCHQRFAALRSGGLSAQKFNRRTELEPATKLSYEALNPPLRKTAVQAYTFREA